MSFATPADVLDRWLTPSPPAEPLIQAWLDDADTLIRWEVPDVDERVGDGRLPVERLVLVECSMVLRVLRNPSGVKSQSQTTGPFATSTSFETAGALVLTDEERNMLVGDAAVDQAAFTIDPTPAAAGGRWPPDPWRPL